MEKNNKDVIFLFGAGISTPIGIPAMEGIYKSYMDKAKSGINDNDKKTCQYFTSVMGVNPDLEEFLLAANTIIQFKGTGLDHFVESNISRVKSSSKIKDYNKNLKQKIKDVENVKKGILDFLSRTCFQFDRAKAEFINTGFINAVSGLGYPVYSTNYDYSLEHVAIENDIEIIDNFTEHGQQTLWNDDINFDGDRGLKLIKLHGSVTWYEDSEGAVEKIYSNTNINPVGKHVDNIVIVPTRFKDIYSQIFFALYSHFLSSLTLSKVIIIAGHSLRDDYLRAAIIERKRQGDFQIIVIDPTYPPEIKKELPPSRLGTNGDVIHLPYKWEEISDELSNILLNSSYKDIGIKCIDVLKKQKYIKNKLKIKGNLGVLRISEEKTFDVEVQAYLNLSDKPSNLRAWLKASHPSESGSIQEKCFVDFIECNEVVFGNHLTGVVNTTQNIAIKIPRIDNWIKAGCKVSLCVGLVKNNVKNPLKISTRNLIVEDCKLLTYKQ